MGHLRGRVIVVGGQNAGAIAHPLRRLDEHPAELTAADDAQRRRGIQHGRSGSASGRPEDEPHAGASPTASV